MSYPSYVPFKNFLALSSFIASIGISLAVSSSFGLATSTSFLGSQDDTKLALVRHSSVIFTWSAAVYGAGLVVSLLAQLLCTSPNFANRAVSGPYVGRMTWMMGSMAWTSLGLVGGGTALVGEGLKVIDTRAGAMLQWILLAFGLPTLLFWIFLGSGKDVDAGPQETDRQLGVIYD